MRSITWAIIASSLVIAASNAYAWKQERRHKNPNLPGIIHSAPCKELAPGVYDCGQHKNQARREHKRTGRWKVTVRPTEDITVTAKSKAEREFEKNSR